MTRFGRGRRAYRSEIDRRRRPVVESLEGRALLTLNFSSAFGIGGDAISIDRVALDAQGDTYATGFFTGRVDFDPGSGNVTLDAGANPTAFVAKYSSSNTLLWVKEFSSSISSEGNGIAVDNNGSVYVVGTFTGTVDFDPGSGQFILTSSGSGSNKNGFVVKLTPNGDLDSNLARNFGGSMNVTGTNVTLSPDGTNVYVVGSYTGAANFDPGGTNSSLTDSDPTKSDAYALKLTSNLGFNWVQSANLTDSAGYGIAADGLGNVYVAGVQHLISFDASTGVFVGVSFAGDAFVSKFNNGALVSTKLFGGTSFGGSGAGAFGAGAFSVVTDTENNVYIAGGFMGKGVNFNPSGAVVPLDSLGGLDSFVVKFDPSLNNLWARRFGSLHEDVAFSLAIDGSNNLYVAGIVQGVSTFGTTGVGTLVLNPIGFSTSSGDRAFVLKVDSDGNNAQALGAINTGTSRVSGIAVNRSGMVAIGGNYAPTSTFGTTALQGLGTSQSFVATLTDTNGAGGGGGGGGGGSSGGGGGSSGGGGIVTSPPTLTGEQRLYTGKGKRRKLVGFMLNFSSALNSSVARDTNHYHVTQPGPKKRSPLTGITVRTASYDSAHNSVTLTLGKFNKNKPLTLTATGLVGSNGASVSNIVNNL